MMMSDGITFPCGIRFRPTDKELLIYLQRKILHLPLPSNMIKEIELYNYHPSEIGRPGEEVDNKSYFLTRIEAKHLNGEKRNRVAKNGNWKATEKPKFIYDYRKNKVGIKRSLVFMSSEKIKTNWHMEEYQTDEHMQKNDNSTKKNNWVLCSIYEHINAAEKKKRKHKAAGSSIARNINPEEVDDDQGQSLPRKRQKGDVVSNDEEVTHHLDIIEWNEEEKKLLQDLLDFEPPLQIIPSTTEQVPQTRSITGGTDGGRPSDVGSFLLMDRPYDVGPPSFMGPDHYSFSAPQDSNMSHLSGPYQTSSLTGGDANQGQLDDVGPFSFNGLDQIPFSISQASSLGTLPGPHLTSSITGGDANQGQSDDVGAFSFNGLDQIPFSISQGSSLEPLLGPQLSSSVTGGDANHGQFDDVYPFSFNGWDHIPISISQGSSLEPLPGPQLTSSMTGGDANQGQFDDVGPFSFNGPDQIPFSISQGSSLEPLLGPQLTSSMTGGDANQGQSDDVGAFSFNGLDQIPCSISQGSKQGDEPSDLLLNESQSCGDWNEDFLNNWLF